MRDFRKIREKVVIRLEHRQVALAIFGFIVVSIGTFTAGVVVGKQMSDQVPDSIAQLTGIDEVNAKLQSTRDHRLRGTRLAEVHPTTGNVHRDLVSPARTLRPNNPTNAARIETHRQLTHARATGIARSLGPVPVGKALPPRSPRPAFDHVRRNPERERQAFKKRAQPAKRFALQVSAFNALGPARTVAQELKKTGHAAKVREVAMNGALSYRVEVGEFGSAREASRFQRRFERRSGYSTVMVPVL